MQKIAPAFEGTLKPIANAAKPVRPDSACLPGRPWSLSCAALGLTLLCASSFAQAQAGAGASLVEDSYEYARVLNSIPLPGPQVARQICQPVTVVQQQAVASRNSGNVIGAIAGGVLGAVVGSRFGGGHGRDAATVAGAIGGTMIGQGMGDGSPASPELVTTTQQNCQTVYEAGPPAGYKVTYDYQGRLYTSILTSPPGAQLRLRKRITVE